MPACAYCGALGAATKDHAPPKAVFPKPRPSTLVSVRACQACNNGASADDEYFVDTILKWHRIAELPKVQPLVDRMIRAAAMPQKQAYARMTLASMGDAEVVTQGGIHLGNQSVFRVDGTRMARAAERYLRGLYRHERGQPVPVGYSVVVGVNPESVLASQETWIPWIRDGVQRVIQDDIFLYGYARAVDRLDAEVWLMLFYGEFPVLGFVRPPYQAVPKAGEPAGW